MADVTLRVRLTRRPDAAPATPAVDFTRQSGDAGDGPDDGRVRAPQPAADAGDVTPPAAPPGTYPVDVFETIDGVPSVRKQNVGDVPGGTPYLPAYVTLGIAFLNGLSSIFHGGSGGDELRGDLDRLKATVGGLAYQLLGFALSREYGDGAHTSLAGKIIGVIGGLINTIAGIVRKFSKQLGDWLAPLVKIIKKLRDVIRRIYDHWLKPILQVIEVVRAFLRVLEFFHIKWAAKADAALATLERKLTAPILLIVAKLNEALNLINRVVTLDGLLTRVTLLQSLWKHAAGAAAVFWNSQVTGLTPREKSELADRDVAHVNPREHAEALEALYTGEGGPLAGVVEELVPVWRIAAGLEQPTDEPF